MVNAGLPSRRRWPVVVLASLVMLAGGLVLARTGTAGVRSVPWFWLACCALGEAGWIRLPDGRSTLSMASIANFAAALALPQEQAVLCASLGCFVVESSLMRKPIQRALYNGGATALTMAATAWVLRVFPVPPGAVPGSIGSLAPLLAGATTFYVVNRACVLGILSVDLGLAPQRVWRQDFGVRRDVLPSGAALSLGVLLAHEYQAMGPLTLALLVLPALFVLEAHRRAAAAGAAPARDERTSEEKRAA